MRLHYRRALTLLLSVLVCTSAALVSISAPAAWMRTEDLNRDGKPDVWRSYTSDGRLASVAVDTNFDGRSDVLEFYDDGALIRRESDRDFNDQIDLVQEFDQATQKIVRSVADVNSDGVGDLLVLFQDGRPVYSKWARAIRPVARDSIATRMSRPVDLPLVSLVDPFSADLAFKAVRVASAAADSLGFPEPVGIPEDGRSAVGIANSSPTITFDDQSESRINASPSSLRGPPAPHFLG